MDYDMIGLGVKIGNTIDLIRTKVDSISDEDLAEFENYLTSLDTAMPLTNPNLYIRRGHDDIDKAGARLRLIRRIKHDLKYCGGSD